MSTEKKTTGNKSQSKGSSSTKKTHQEPQEKKTGLTGKLQGGRKDVK